MDRSSNNDAERARQTFQEAMRVLGLSERAQLALLAAASSWVKAAIQERKP